MEFPLTKYERTRLIGFRASQLSQGAKPTVEIPKGEYDPINIALLELKKGTIPVNIIRELPCGQTIRIKIKAKT